MLESKRDKILYQVVVPVATALLGAAAGAVFQAVTLDKAQISDVIALLKDPALTAAQKLQALAVYKEITDRPWAIIRTFSGAITFAVPTVLMAMVVGGQFQRKG
ncbi:hypothetical protein [Sphingomonas palmae]|uniref:hypothetical protein n=1 Tax=Sphingomonas palmae TaxID=1855283 RepID=UPI00115FEA7B|nr:hypothetical protein [Sphingomonas palmae]